MLLLHAGKIRPLGPAPIPAGLLVAKGIIVEPFRGIDDVHLRPRPVHQDHPQSPDIVRTPPIAPPPFGQQIGILEGRLGVRRELLDQLVVAPFVFRDRTHAARLQ